MGNDGREGERDLGGGEEALGGVVGSGVEGEVGGRHDDYYVPSEGARGWWRRRWGGGAEGRSPFSCTFRQQAKRSSWAVLSYDVCEWLVLLVGAAMA